MKRLLLSILLLCAVGARADGTAPAALPALAVDAAQITVSGISSGAYMAVQYHIAHSASVRGAGALAGGPYDCAAGSTWAALTRCVAPRFWSPLPATDVLVTRIEQRAQGGEIDAVAGLAGDRAWVFAGGRDGTVERPVVDALVALYGQWLPASAVAYIRHKDAGHAMISTEDPGANPCPTSKPPYINRCGDFDAAGEMLAHLLGPLAPKQEPPAEPLRRFDQRPFLGDDPVASGMADEGYLFVPEGCEGGGCRVHVVFHGCRQSSSQIGTRFAENAGYLEWAQSNRLVVLFPQVIPRYGWSGGITWVFNPKGCWDWWGYTGNDYATRAGRQIRAIKAMVDRVGERRKAGD